MVGALAVVTSLVAATPALANSNSTADIAAPLRTAQASKQTELGHGDQEFRRLFASWQSLDKPGAQIARPNRRIGGVAIPSRMPVDGVRLTSDYGMRWHPVTGGRRAHKGVDLAGPAGSPVRATADGMVGRAEWYSSFGLYVSLRSLSFADCYSVAEATLKANELLTFDRAIIKKCAPSAKEPK